LVEVRVQSLGLDRRNQSPVVILQERDGGRVLPIWIGPGEASAIAMRLANMTFARPLTHDLLVSVVRELGGSLERVQISRVEADTYYAELVLTRDGHEFTVDARPSDSIALALRMDAAIFADDSLLEHASIEVSEDQTVIEMGRAETDTAPGSMGPEELKEYLRNLNPEDFGRFTP